MTLVIAVTCWVAASLLITIITDYWQEKKKDLGFLIRLLLTIFVLLYVGISGMIDHIHKGDSIKKTLLKNKQVIILNVDEMPETSIKGLKKKSIEVNDGANIYYLELEE